MLLKVAHVLRGEIGLDLLEQLVRKVCHRMVVPRQFWYEDLDVRCNATPGVARFPFVREGIGGGLQGLRRRFGFDLSRNDCVVNAVIEDASRYVNRMKAT